MTAHRLVERVPGLGARLHEALGALRDHPLVGDIRGRGLLAGVEFVADRETRVPFPRALRFAETFTRVAQEHGLVVWPSVGHVPDGSGDMACLAPPFVVTEGEIDEIVTRCRAALDATQRRLGIG
jgi:adenosylmethionine-8-amino-7-oxononanoate aminotransferase